MRLLLAVLVSLAVLPSVASAAAPRRVLISADLAAGLGATDGSRTFPSDVDDAIAVAWAVSTPGLDVDAVIGHYGNNEAAAITRQTWTMVHDVMGRRDIRIEQGPAGPMTASAERGRGAADPCVTPGVQLLADELRRAPATVLELGNLTTIGCLVRAFPKESANVDELVVESGRAPGEVFYLREKPGVTDTNFNQDPYAAELVLRELPAPITFDPWSVNSSTILDDARLDRLGGDTPIGRWLRENIRTWRTFWDAAFQDMGIRAWDQHVIFYLQHPDAYVVEDTPWKVVSCAGEGPRKNASTDCAGHGPTQVPTLDAEKAQLWLGQTPGQTRRDGIRTMRRFRSPADQQAFLDEQTALHGPDVVPAGPSAAGRAAAAAAAQGRLAAQRRHAAQRRASQRRAAARRAAHRRAVQRRAVQRRAAARRAHARRVARRRAAAR